MSSTDENEPEANTEPLLDAIADDAEPETRGGRSGTTGPARTAGQEALEQALSQSGKNLDDLT
ncbi:hypothetical protein HII36_00345 [Nonomuraea sp. NN258]|uniref:hypothetical protein n=1 Tax=Nonomuraea antri TaxID=2730852 RepID=UPI0015698071|nr:hypothetical protein [Nonomuraea antri]NRQ30293.1 hypothetical protein [Nonomuraea antri]